MVCDEIFRSFLTYLDKTSILILFIFLKYNENQLKTLCEVHNYQCINPPIFFWLQFFEVLKNILCQALIMTSLGLRANINFWGRLTSYMLHY